VPYYYRFHWEDCPPLSAQNAWSALWGAQRTADGSQTVCVACDGTGRSVTGCVLHRSCDGQGCGRCEDGYTTRCESCDGEGLDDCQRGYSCFAEPGSLIDYFAYRDEPADGDGVVVVFTGEYQGTGFDGEDLVVPAVVVEELTWSAFRARIQAGTPMP
jgi:hypothetical protein